ncbi:hypothetical protein RFI_33414, partial [Reticulomyxa filosa]
CKDNPIVWYDVLSYLQQLHEEFVEQVGDRKIGWNFNPNFEARSQIGYSGLYNYGCTCYCNASMQQLYANPMVRKILLGMDLRKKFPYEEIQDEHSNQSQPPQTTSGGTEKQHDASNSIEEESDSTGEKKKVKKRSKMRSTVVYALQEMFTALQYSNRRTYVPNTFRQNYRTSEGNEIDVHEQV